MTRTTATTHEVDVVVLGRDPEGKVPQRVLALGEAKSNDVVGRAHLRRLERVRELAPGAGPATKLLLFSGKGFGEALVDEVRGRTDVELVDLHRLYDGA